MTPERWERVSELFASALQHEPGERSAFLWRICADDRELIAEVESLIHAHEGGGELALPGTMDTRTLVRDAWLQATDSSAPDTHVGTTVANRYRIDARLGRGGAGPGVPRQRSVAAVEACRGQDPGGGKRRVAE